MFINGREEKFWGALHNNQLNACLVYATSPHAYDAIGTAGGTFTEVGFPGARPFTGPAILLPTAAQRAAGAVHGVFVMNSGSTVNHGRLRHYFADGFNGTSELVADSVWPAFSGTFKVLDLSAFTNTFAAPPSGAQQCTINYLNGEIDPLEFEAPAAGTVLGVAFYDASDNALCALISAGRQAVCLENATLPKADVFTSISVDKLGTNFVSSRGVACTFNSAAPNLSTADLSGSGDLFARDRLIATPSFPKVLDGDPDFILRINTTVELV